MKHSKYFPSEVDSQLVWAQSYKANIAIKGPGLGLTPEKITGQEGMCDAMIEAIGTSKAAKLAAKDANKAKNLVIKSSMETLRPDIRTIKANSAYTENIGLALGIIGSEIDFDVLTVKTVVVLAKTPEGIDIKFTLEYCEGGNIYCKRGSDTEFKFLKHITHPHTVDTRANENNASSESRQYLVVLVLDDHEVGIPSDIATIKN